MSIRQAGESCGPHTNLPRNKEAELSGGNHVYDTWNIIEHLTNHLIVDVVFLNSHCGNVEYLTDATMEENFKLLEKVFV